MVLDVLHSNTTHILQQAVWDYYLLLFLDYDFIGNSVQWQATAKGEDRQLVHSKMWSTNIDPHQKIFKQGFRKQWKY